MSKPQNTGGPMGERAQVASAAVASIGRAVAQAEQAHAHGRYRVECIGADGQVKWADYFDNLVTTVGKNDMPSVTSVAMITM